MTLTMADLITLVCAVWLLASHARNLGRMSHCTRWLPYLQVLSVTASSSGVLLAYAQIEWPAPELTRWLNPTDMVALLLGSLVMSSVIDPRRSVCAACGVADHGRRWVPFGAGPPRSGRPGHG